jgi:hypothetical protein
VIRARFQLVALVILASCVAPPDAPPGVEDTVRTLASAAYGGRLTGSPGARAAADYLAAQLARIGAGPLPGRAYEIPFEFAAGTRDAGSSLAIEDAAGSALWGGAGDVSALSFSSSAEVEAPVVFAGYGLVVPDALGLAYDSYAGLDVEGRIVVVLRYFPEDLPQEERGVLSRYSGLRYKAMLARERGAVGLVVATGPRSPNAGQTVPMTFDTAVSGSGIVAASVSGAVAERLFTGARLGLEDAQAALDAGDPHAGGFPLDLEATLSVRVERERREGRNVVGLLPATAPAPSVPYVIVGAHFDHLGTGGHGNSLARDEERGQIHYGADDNASGVAAVLRIGELLTGSERPRNVVLALWSGEELGLLGSAAFLEQDLVPPADIAAYVNFDMVGRMRDDRLLVYATGTSPVWPELLEQTNATAGFDLQLTPDPYLPTDSVVFDRVDVPTLSFFTGPHEDYHRPTDTADRIDTRDLERLAHFGAALVSRIAALDPPPAFTRIERSFSPGPGRDALRAYTGTIPDYTGEGAGLTLAGVVEGGPAAEAGLRGGDVIVQLGSLQITNIYDYTYALDSVKIGEPVTVIYLRGGERREAVVIPQARR